MYACARSATQQPSAAIINYWIILPKWPPFPSLLALTRCLDPSQTVRPPLSQITLQGLHSPLTLSDSPSFKGHTLQRLPLRLVLLHTNTPHTFLLELHEALPWPQE